MVDITKVKENQRNETLGLEVLNPHEFVKSWLSGFTCQQHRLQENCEVSFFFLQIIHIILLCTNENVAAPIHGRHFHFLFKAAAMVGAVLWYFPEWIESCHCPRKEGQRQCPSILSFTLHPLALAARTGRCHIPQKSINPPPCRESI